MYLANLILVLLMALLSILILTIDIFISATNPLYITILILSSLSLKNNILKDGLHDKLINTIKKIFLKKKKKLENES